MALYVYRRPDGTTFEHRQSIASPPLETCPETGVRVERLISGGTFALRGGGWASDGYKQTGPPLKER